MSRFTEEEKQALRQQNQALTNALLRPSKKPTTSITRFSPSAKGWVVRLTSDTHVSWWYGPQHGWGTTSGPLDYSVAVFPTKKEAVAQARQMGWRRNLTVERVADAVAFEITRCDERKASALAGTHPDRKRIAASNDKVKRYLQGKVATR